MSLTAELLATFEKSAVRLECQQTYTMPAEQEDLERFLSGGDKPPDHNASWMETVSRNREAGKVIQRIKVVRRPLTDYTRYLFGWVIPDNVASGEDYRILDGADADELAIPNQDYWVFDERTVLLLNFNPDGTLQGRELADVSELGQYLQWRNLALAKAVPFSDYRL